MTFYIALYSLSFVFQWTGGTSNGPRLDGAKILKMMNVNNIRMKYTNAPIIIVKIAFTNNSGSGPGTINARGTVSHGFVLFELITSKAPI
jgi:hypothetical protein